MKKLIAAIALFILIPLQACAQVELWQEGTHYKVIAEKASDKPVVKEFFSFWCPACYRFEPLVAQIKEGLAEDVTFTKVHVNFMGFTSKEVQDEATKAMVMARALKVSDKVNAAIFDYIHRQKASINGIEDLRSIFIVNGIEPEKFDKALSNFTVKNMLVRNNKEIENFRENLTGVPNFIVNDKYQAIFSRDMSASDYVALINWLSKQK